MDKKQDTAKEAHVAYEVDDFEGGIPSIVLHEQYVVDRKGKKVAVILPFEQYQQMKEDLHDLALVAERREKAPISLEEMKRRLMEDGLLKMCAIAKRLGARVQGDELEFYKESAFEKVSDSKP